MATITEVRNADLQDLITKLKEQKVDKLDAIVPAQKIRARGGLLRVDGLSVFGDAVVLRPTEIMDGGIADKLGIPVKYLRKMRTERPDLFDANVNGWLHGCSGWMEADGSVAGTADGDGRNFMLRAFMGEPGSEGIGRALLSDTYAPIENLDVAFAALEGIQESGEECQLVWGNLSERRMALRFYAPGIAALAPVLMEGYKSPVEGLEVPNWAKTLDSLAKSYSPEHLGWDKSKGETPPVAFGGFEVRNSETGGGAFEIVPVLSLFACKNGLTIEALKVRKVHLGSKLDEGQIKWSQDTLHKLAALVKAQTRDAVKQFLDPQFVMDQVGAIEAKAGKELTKPAETIELIATKLAYSEEAQEGILAHFIKGGQLTAGGVLNAVTSYAQTVPNVDTAADIESSALEALELAYAAA